MIELKDFGRDHWSTFAYAECCCVDHGGRLDIRRLRINEDKRPIKGNGLGWKSDWATRTNAAWPTNKPDPSHDDIDCLDDLEREGLLEQIGTLINPVVKLTQKGIEVAAAIRRHKAKGGQFSTFVPSI